MKKVKYYGVAKVEYPRDIHPVCNQDTISSVVWADRKDALRDLVRHTSRMLTPKLYIHTVYDGKLQLRTKDTDRLVVDVFLYEVEYLMESGEELEAITE